MWWQIYKAGGPSGLITMRIPVILGRLFGDWRFFVFESMEGDKLIQWNSIYLSLNFLKIN
jgi:hypothetical protein